MYTCSHKEEKQQQTASVNHIDLLESCWSGEKFFVFFVSEMFMFVCFCKSDSFAV